MSSIYDGLRGKLNNSVLFKTTQSVIYFDIRYFSFSSNNVNGFILGKVTR